MIGIFDSGIGGLTVVKEVIKQLPDYQLVYFGDTARTPYGNKSRETIIKYALEDTDFLIRHGAKLIIIACNTASAVASAELKAKYPEMPIFEVISPAVNKANQITKTGRIGVIGTRATINSRIYEEKIKALADRRQVFGQPCPLFVPLAEEGWIDKPVTKMVARQYLLPLKMKQIDTLILGCTHYPLLKPIIKLRAGKGVRLVDPAEETASRVKKFLIDNKNIADQLTHGSNHAFYFSDLTPHLSSLASQWLGQPIKPVLQQLN